MNQPMTILPSGSRTTANDQDVALVQRDCDGLHVIVDVTVNAGGLGSLTVSIYGKDPASGKKYLLLASAALTAVATTVLRVFAGATAAANLAANDLVPNDFVVSVAHGAGGPIAYSIGAQLVS